MFGAPLIELGALALLSLKLNRALVSYKTQQLARVPLHCSFKGEHPARTKGAKFRILFSVGLILSV